MANREIINYIRRNLIISEGLARTIPDTNEEQEIHLMRALEGLAKLDQNLANEITNSQVDIAFKRQQIWRAIKVKKLTDLTYLLKPLKYLTVTLTILAIVIAIANFAIENLRTKQIWHAEYFNNINLEGPATYITEASNISFDWSGKTPSSQIAGDRFSLRLKTCLVLTENKTLKFSIASDDGSRLSIDKKRIIDSWKIQAAAEILREMPLEAGAHLIEIEYFQAGGASNLKFEIKDNDISANNLLTDATGAFSRCKK